MPGWPLMVWKMGRLLDCVAVLVEVVSVVKEAVLLLMVISSSLSVSWLECFNTVLIFCLRHKL